MNRLLCATALFLAVSLPATAGSSLTSSELRNLAPGRYQVVLYNAISMTVTMKPNGVVVGTASGDRDTGTWSLSGNRLCIAWRNWLGGQARCSGLVADGNKFRGNGFTFKRI